MEQPIISIQNLNKKYCRSLKRSLYYGMRDVFGEMIGGRRQNDRLRIDEFWALKNVTFEVCSGETIGLIGRNGAGKTTLLKLLSGLIRPDGGRIEIRGRLQALIALGAGFNPVLTGRENIFINAAVLGISKTEIDHKFDEIVDFSGLAEFIDTPIQSYSSGMVVRLGFSVAAHLEPDILLIDEVLAVGDIPFRAKCHRKLGEMKERGIPWIMVSHDLGTIRNQTTKVIYLEKGQIQFIGTPENAISEYLYSISQEELTRRSKNAEVQPQQNAEPVDVKINGVELLNANYQEKPNFQTGEPLVVKIDYTAYRQMEQPSFGIHIFNGEGICYTGTSTSASRFHIDRIDGSGSVYYHIDELPLLPGIYRVRADIWDKNMSMRDKQNEGAYLHVRDGKFSVGMFYTPHSWSIEKKNEP